MLFVSELRDKEAQGMGYLSWVVDFSSSGAEDAAIKVLATHTTMPLQNMLFFHCSL